MRKVQQIQKPYGLVNAYEQKESKNKESIHTLKIESARQHNHKKKRYKLRRRFKVYCESGETLQAHRGYGWMDRALSNLV